MAFVFEDEAPQEGDGQFVFEDQAESKVPMAPVTVERTYSPTEGMSRGEKFSVGAIEGLLTPARSALNIVGLYPDELLREKIETYAPVTQSGAGLAGNVGGQTAGILGAGGLLKLLGRGAQAAGLTRTGQGLSAAGQSVVAPTTVGRAAAGGAVVGGALTPADDMVDRAGNVFMGAAGAGVGQKIGGLISQGISRLAPQNPVIVQQLDTIMVNAGIDPSTLGSDVQRSLVAGLESGKLTPEAAVRLAKAKSLEVPVSLTKGAATRDFGQQQAESGLRLMDEGAAIRQQDIENNAALIRNMELLGQKQKATQTGPYFVGKSVQEAAKGAEEVSLKKATDLLQAGREAGQNVMVDPAPIVSRLMNNIDDMKAQNDAGAALSVSNMLQRLGYATVDQAGNLVPTGKAMSATEAMSLYHSANRASTPNSQRHMSDVKKGIMQALEGADGGEEFKKGISLFRQHMQKYDDPRAIKNLLAMSSDSDPKIAAEKVFDRGFVKASVDDVDTLRKMMLSSDKSVRGDAVKAVRNMRGALVDNLLESSFAGQATDELGNRVVSGVNLRKAIERIGGGKDIELGYQKVEALLGKRDTEQLRKIVDVAFDATNKVPGAAKTSGTTERLLNFMSKLPLAPSTVLQATKDAIAKQKSKSAAEAATKAFPAIAEAARPIPSAALIGATAGSPLAAYYLNQPSQ